MSKKNKINAIDILLGTVSYERSCMGVVHFSALRDQPVAITTDGHRMTLLEVGADLSPGEGMSLSPEVAGLVLNKKIPCPRNMDRDVAFPPWRQVLPSGGRVIEPGQLAQQLASAIETVAPRHRGRIRVSFQENEPPFVWIAIPGFGTPKLHRDAVTVNGEYLWETAISLGSNFQIKVTLDRFDPIEVTGQGLTSIIMPIRV